MYKPVSVLIFQCHALEQDSKTMIKRAEKYAPQKGLGEWSKYHSLLCSQAAKAHSERRDTQEQASRLSIWKEQQLVQGYQHFHKGSRTCTPWIFVAFASIDQLKQISHDYTIHSLLSLFSCFFTSSGLGRKTSDINMSWESPNLRTQSRASEAEGREFGSLEHIMSNKSMSGWERWWRYWEKGLALMGKIHETWHIPQTSSWTLSPTARCQHEKGNTDSQTAFPVQVSSHTRQYESQQLEGRSQFSTMVLNVVQN